jgi:hypothetical protein
LEANIGHCSQIVMSIHHPLKRIGEIWESPPAWMAESCSRFMGNSLNLPRSSAGK